MLRQCPPAFSRPPPGQLISSLVQKPGRLNGVPAVGASTNFTAGPLG